MLRNIDSVLWNLYLLKSVGYFHYLLEYVLKRSITNDQFMQYVIITIWIYFAVFYG